MSEARRRRTRSRSHKVDEAAEAIVRHHSRVGRCVDVAFKRTALFLFGVLVELVKATDGSFKCAHASSARVGDLVIEVAAMLEVRACAVHTRLSLAPSVRHLRVACVRDAPQGYRS